MATVACTDLPDLPEWMTALRDAATEADATGDDDACKVKFMQKMLLRLLDIRAKMENERVDLVSLKSHVTERLEQLRCAEERVRAAEAAWAGRALDER